jgi:glucose/mannose transport system permease protein
MAATVLVAYLGSMLWTLGVSFTSSRTFPPPTSSGLDQYQRLFDNERWSQALHNLAVYGVLFIVACLLIGTLLAIFMDQKVRAEGVLRTIFLYPYAMSFVATGLVWQWVMNPEVGLQQAVRQLGFESFTFDWIVDPDRVIYTIVIAAVWQASGLVMALVLAGCAAWTKRSGRPRASKASRVGACTCRSCCPCWGPRCHHLRAAVCGCGEGL